MSHYTRTPMPTLAKPFFLRMSNKKPEVGIKFKQFEPYPSPPDQYRLIWLIEECAKVEPFQTVAVYEDGNTHVDLKIESGVTGYIHWLIEVGNLVSPSEMIASIRPIPIDIFEKLLLTKAEIFARAAYGATGQRRKYTDEPYIVHPQEVVALVSSRPHDVKMLVAAWLHDIVEDTSISLDLIQSEFEETVANYVYWLTNPSKPEDGNRAKRKEIDREHLRKAPPQAKTIKLAGIISNCSTIKERSPEFATTYIKEKQLMLEVLEGGDPVLMEQAKQLLGD